MLSNKEFKSINNKCFTDLGCKKIKKYYVFETKNVFFVFIILKSNFCDCYYIDYNIVIKMAHSAITISMISEKEFDFVLQPRLTLCDGTVELKLDNLVGETYESNLKLTLENFVYRVNKSDLNAVNDIIGKENCIVRKETLPYLNEIN